MNRSAAERLEEVTSLRPRILLVLGSGLGRVAESLTDAASVPLHELPGVRRPTVAGHDGRLLAGRLDGVPVWVQAGRLHLYEGQPPRVVMAPIRMAAAAGVEVVLLTNAAGGIRWDLGPGSLVLLDDLLNLTFRSPLAGPAREGQARFPDMSEPFDRDLQELAEVVAGSAGVSLSRGTYAGVAGPSFETPAEIRMISKLGGDVVGMSTVPEVHVARATGLRLLGLSLVTNRAAGLTEAPLSHREVVEAAGMWAERVERVVCGVVGRLAAKRPTGGAPEGAPRSG